MKRKINYGDVVSVTIRVGKAAIGSEHLHFPDVIHSERCCSICVQTRRGDKVCVAHVIACMCKVCIKHCLIRARLAVNQRCYCAQ